jgi:hypothetical protein
MQSHLVVPEVVLSIDRACVPHDGGQHGSKETRSQPHDGKSDSSLVELKAKVMLVSRRGKYSLLQTKKQPLDTSRYNQEREEGMEGGWRRDKKHHEGTQTTHLSFHTSQIGKSEKENVP